MSLYRPDPSQVTLQLTAHNIDGTPKLALASAKVRVYHMNGASELEDLALIDLTQVGTTNTWRYVWASPTMPVGVYFAEYALVDNDGANFTDFDTLFVMDVALEESLDAVQGDVTGLMADVELIKQLKIGSWEIINNQMIYKDTSGAEIARLNLYDIAGVLTNGINMYKREPA